MAEDLRALLRVLAGRDGVPSAVILDSRTIQSTPESGGRAGYDGAKKRKGSKVHAAVDTPGHLLALRVTVANEQDREQVGALAQAVQAATGANVQLAYVDQGYTGQQASEAAKEHGIHLEVVKLQEAKIYSVRPGTLVLSMSVISRSGGSRSNSCSSVAVQEFDQRVVPKRFAQHNVHNLVCVVLVIHEDDAGACRVV